MDNTSIGDRMKKYEMTSKSFLLRRTPVIIRVDGKAFHTWTKRLNKIDPSLGREPYSSIMHSCMTGAANAMMILMQNAVFAYTQSDEISILLNDWKSVKSDQWYAGNVQKICSVSASIAATSFNYCYQGQFKFKFNNEDTDLAVYHTIYDLAQFDARVFNLPREEVANYFIWRQQDATRNSINMLGQYFFPHKSLHGKNVSQVQDKLMLEQAVNWNDIDTWKKRGSCIIPNPCSVDSSAAFIEDENIPIFTQDRNYIEQHLKTGEE